MKRWFLPFILLFVLTSCRMPSLLPQALKMGEPGRGGMVLQGRIVDTRTVAAVFEDIARGATVALIDSESGHTLGTTVTTPDATFAMTFGEGFAPVDGRAYYLDVLKGVRLNPNDPQSPFNQAGADVLRLRNILYYQAPNGESQGGWMSLMSATPGNYVEIGNRSTTLSIAIALKRQAGETVNLPDFVGALEQDPFVPLGGVSYDGFESLKAIVLEAIANDRDPLQYAVYDENRGIFLNPWVGFAISDVFPGEGGIGTEITIVGDGFDLDTPVVAVNGVQATIVSTTADTIRAIVNPGTRTGPVSVKLGTTTQAGPTFRVKFQDGHSALLNGKLYVANPSWHTVVEVSPNGDVKKIWDRDTLADLNTPTQIAAWNGKLYVSCRGNGKILRLDPMNPAASEVFNPTSIITSAYGLAFDVDGNLYVSSWRAAPNGVVVKLNSAGVMVDQITGLDRPRGIAFDYLGNLFVAEEGGRIAKLTAPAMTAETWGIVPSPMGLAVDSAGDCFVTSNTNNVIYRITRYRAMSVFSMLNRPGGITIDDKGYLYVSDTVKNVISRISPLGDSKIYAYGISDPRGLAVDPNLGTVYVSLSQSNAILKVENGVLKPFVTGIANPMTINFRGDGLLIAHPETHTVSFARRSGQLSTLATGLEFPGGADQAVDGGGSLTGPLYIPRFGDTESADARRLPRYDIRALTYGERYGVDVIDGGVKTHRRWLYRHNGATVPATYVAIDGSGNFYILDTTDLTLTRVGAAPGGGNSSRALTRLCGDRSPYQFQGAPAWVAVDAGENVYVSVPSEHAIYRFVKAAGYAMDKITGFNSPWGIAFSDTTPQAMYVSNTVDGEIRRVTNPATALTADVGFSIPTGNASIRGLAYMASGTAGTGTLYMAAGTTVVKADLSANNYVGASYGNYVTGLPVSWSYLYAKASTKELFGFGNVTYAHKISAPPEKTISEFLNLTGDSILGGFTFDANFNTYRWTRRYGIATLAPLGTTREVELQGNTLYVASPDTYSGHGNAAGGVLRIDLTTGNELYVPLRSYSLGFHAGSGNLYVGASDSRIYQVTPQGVHTSVWSLGTVPYGLDVRGGTVWAVGADGRIFEQVIGNATITGHKFGMKEPGF